MSSKKSARNAKTGGLGNHASLALVAVAVPALTVLLMWSLLGSGGPGPAEEPDAARQAALASEHSPSVGDPGAKVHIVEFLDPACGTCALFYPMVKQWMAQVPGKIRLTIRHVTFHEGVEYAVRVLEASRNQDRYWQTLEALLASQGQWVRNHVVQPQRVLPAIAGVGLDIQRLEADMNSDEVRRRMEKDMQDSVTLRVSATPDYFVNGRALPSFGQQELADLIREELEK